MEKNIKKQNSVRSQALLKRYHQLTSPLVSLNKTHKQQSIKQELKHNISMRLDAIKNGKTSIYTLTSPDSFSDLKAGATLYQIPQFSVPEVNYEVAERIKAKVQEAKNELVCNLPDISRSSNYAPKKLQHQLNHRSAVKGLEQWLKEHLKNPPVNYQQSLEYKNMIMGVGMKELIRIVGRRCAQEGRIAEEIWQLTWNICKEIIIYLSKRAKKCQELLDEQLQFMRQNFQQEFNRLQALNVTLSQTLAELQQQNSRRVKAVQKSRNQRQLLQEQNSDLKVNNFHLQSECKRVLQQNLAMYLQIGGKGKRDWIKKVYKNMNENHSKAEGFKQIFKAKIAQVIKDRNITENITGDDQAENIDPQQIEAIGTNKDYKSKKKPLKTPKQSRISIQESKFRQQNQSYSEQKEFSINQICGQQVNNEDCDKLLMQLKEEFQPIQIGVNTQILQFICAQTNTLSKELIDAETFVNSNILGLLQQIGINTEEPKEDVKPKKKIKQVQKATTTRQQSKILNVPASLSKNKKTQKKVPLNVVSQQQEKIKQNLSGVQKYQSQMTRQTKQIQLSIEDNSSKLTLQQETRKKADKYQTNQKFNLSNKNLYNNNQIAQFATENEKIYITMNTKNDVSNLKSNSKEKNNYKSSQFSNNNTKKVNTQQSSKQHKQNKENQNGMEMISNKTFDEANVDIEKLEKLQRVKSHPTCLDQQLIRLQQCTLYICAHCNQIIMENQQKYPAGKSKSPSHFHVSPPRNKDLVSQRFSNKSSLMGSQKGIHQQNEPTEEFKIKFHRKQTRKRSSFIHDIAYKKDLQQRNSPFANMYKDSTDQALNRLSYDENDGAAVSQLNICNKISFFKYFSAQIQENNKQFIGNINSNQQSLSQSMETYFEMVQEINDLPPAKIAMTEKAVTSVIQKNIFPILNELLMQVRKAVKYNRIGQTKKHFLSLPYVILNRISRKYGVKILAIKNMKIILIALKAANKYTQKYKMIQLMMFTQCKSPYSQDLFIYLLIMGVMDPTFTSNRLLSYDQLYTVRKLCEQNLTKEPQVYNQFQKADRDQEEVCHLSGLVKSVITNYRLIKIKRIQELGFIFLMLKKDIWMDYRLFVYFISFVQCTSRMKLSMAKKLLEYCDVKSKDQKIGITENMFAQFLMNSPQLTLTFLQNNIQKQLNSFDQSTKLVTQLSNKIFNSKNQLSQAQSKQQTVSQEQPSTPLPQTKERSSSIAALTEEPQKPLNADKVDNVQIRQSLEVSPGIKQYSSFTNQVCRYLQNDEETKYLNKDQRLFIKNYLIAHILQNQLEIVVGLVDYFTAPMLELMTTSPQEFKLDNLPHTSV